MPKILVGMSFDRYSSACLFSILIEGIAHCQIMRFLNKRKLQITELAGINSEAN